MSRVWSYRGIVLQVAPYENQTHNHPLGRMKRIEIACAASTSTIFALARSEWNCVRSSDEFVDHLQKYGMP